MRITVVGDLLLDVDLWGPTQRTAPDGGMPIVDISRESVRAGGAGLVATLLRQDGHDVRLVAAIGVDEAAARLRGLLEGVELHLGASNAPTPVKTRLQAGEGTIARFDVGCAPAPAPEVTDEMRAAVGEADAVVVADYGRGMTADAGIRSSLAAVAAHVPVVWDPHPRGSRPIAGVVATPNRSEAAGFAATEDMEAAAARLRAEWCAVAVAVTLGAEGVLLHADRVERRPARVVNVVDGCGSGDRFASAVAAALAAGAGLGEAIDHAVHRTADFLEAGGVAALAGLGVR
ncbi:PfkB family carbohydrate kinase [Gryllotalpicola ginsengisoli]|uniref:PfkB family carbohydrate kinase n=1 Tax=Gryllotalpicola ginsengisoli TaxID=444608 RepID=UPI0003B61E7D|nr:PfkB family carbohydrate kinase [Gryllotalpicola ginsengisoli]